MVFHLFIKTWAGSRNSLKSTLRLPLFRHFWVSFADSSLYFGLGNHSLNPLIMISFHRSPSQIRALFFVVDFD